MRFLLSVVMLFSASVCAYAAEVTLNMRYGDKSIMIEAKDRGLSVFQRFNDLWIISAHETTVVNPDALTRRALGIKAIEQLDVQPKGSGVRISFNKFPESVLTQKEAAYHLLMDQQLNNLADIPQIELTAEPKGQNLLLGGEGLFSVVRAMSLETREYYFVGLIEKVVPQEKGILGNFIKLPTFMGLSFSSLSGLPVQVQPQSGKYLLKTLSSSTLEAMAGSQKKASERVMLPEFIKELTEPQKETPIAVVKRDLTSPSRNIDLARKIDLDAKKSDYMGAMGSLYKALIQIENFGKKEAVPEPVGPDLSLRPNLPSAEDLLRRAQRPEEGARKYNMPVALAADTFLPNYGRLGLKNYYDREKAYIRFFWRARTQEEQTQALLRWAKLKISLERYLDAIGILKTAERLDNGIAKNEEVRLLQGVANAAFGRIEEAERLLRTVAEPNANKSLWQAVVYAQQGKYEAAVKGFNAYEEHIKTYPPKVRQLVSYYYARALYKTDRLDDAIDQIDQLARLGNLSDYLPMSQLLLAQIYNAKEQPNIAEQILVNLVQHPYLPAAHEAIYEYVTLLFNQGKVSRAQYIKHLENLRYTWRGDATERRSLLTLGENYLEDGQYEQGLSMLKYLTTYFANSLEAKQATNDLTETFTALFLEGKAERVMNLTESLSLYYAFRELTPPGMRGDALIESVVDRMKSLNLFDRAITLQEQQLNYRMRTETDKARAGEKLAQLYLLNMQPKEALEVLKNTAPKRVIPKELTAKRQLSLARVYIELNEVEEVEKALGTNNTKEADYLRGEAYWRVNKPQDFIKVVEPYFKEDAAQRAWSFDDNIMYRRLLIALAQAGRKADIDRLKTAFPKQYEQSQFGDRHLFLRQYAEETADVLKAEENPLWEQAAEQLKGFTELEALYNKHKEERAKNVTAVQKYFGQKGSAQGQGGAN